jgi:hypothetical protein
MCIIELRLQVCGSGAITVLLALIFLLQIVVIEVVVEVLLIVDPGADLVWILLVEVTGGWCSVEENILAVVSKVICGKRRIAPENMLTPEVRVLSRLVHGSVWLEVFLDEMLVLLEHECNVLVRSMRIVIDFVKVAAHFILLIVELLKVNSLNAVDVVCHQSAKNTFVQSCDPLLLRECLWILYCIGEDIVYLFKTKVLAVVVCLRHFFV